MQGASALGAAGMSSMPAVARAETVPKEIGVALDKLFPGERTVGAGGFPSLVRFIKGSLIDPSSCSYPTTLFLRASPTAFPVDARRAS